MNNDRPKKTNRPTSIDGFVVNRPSGSARNNNNLRSFNKYHRPNNTGSAPGNIRSIDGFNKGTDGFVSSTQPKIDRPVSGEKDADIMHQFGSRQAESRAYSSHRPTGQSPAKKQGRISRLKSKRQAKKAHKKQGRFARMSKKMRVASVMGAILLLLGGGLAIRAYLLSRNIFKGGGNSALLTNQDIDPSLLKGEGDGRINILVMGKGGAEQEDGPDLTDTIMVASIDPIADEAALLSIPRDFWVKSKAGGQSKINQVYFDAKHSALNDYPYKERESGPAKEKAEQAGVDALKSVVSETMGVPIHYYAMIDFAGFKKAVDTVGGVDVNVTEDMAVSERMWLAGHGTFNLNVGPGNKHMNGVEALAFSRSRKTSAKGDFSRSERQRAVIIALKDKIASTGTLANPVRVNQLISDFKGQLSTDFSVNEMLRLYDLGKEIQSNKVQSIGLDEYVVGDTISGLSVQVPKAGIFDYSEIHNYVRNAMRDAFLKKENARVVVLNGTAKAGLATQKSDELKSYGYNVTSVGDAPTDNYTKTVLVDLRGGQNKYTQNYLQKRFKTTAVSSVPDSSINTADADFIVILGSDLNQ